MLEVERLEPNSCTGMEIERLQQPQDHATTFSMQLMLNQGLHLAQVLLTAAFQRLTKDESPQRYACVVLPEHIVQIHKCQHTKHHQN